MTTLITHQDLDGIGCSIVFQLAHAEKINLLTGHILPDIEMKIIYADYNDIDQVTRDAMGYSDRIIFSDICPTKDTVRYLFEQEYFFEIHDHHATNLYVKELQRSQYPYFPCMINITPKNEDGQLESGTSLLFKHYQEKLKHKYDKQLFTATFELLELFVDTVRSYDTYEWKQSGNTVAKELQTLFSLLTREVFIRKYIGILSSDYHSPPPVVQLIDHFDMEFIQSKLAREQQRIDEITIDDVQPVAIGNYTGILHHYNGLNTSELAHQFLTKYPLNDIFLDVDYNTGVVSIRTTKENIDTGREIAKPCGGGGHPGASGFSIPKELIEKAANIIIEYINDNIKAN